MVRKPNYRFDRLERERKKADKKAAKLKAKRGAKGGTVEYDSDKPPEDVHEPSLDVPPTGAHGDVGADD
jgi:hypothetical protein